MIINKLNLGKYIVPPDCRNGICLDIGANVGNFYSKYNLFFYMIHYYEPVDENWNICNNKKYKNIFGFNEAVGSNNDKLIKLVCHKNNESGSCRVENDHPDWTNEVVGKVKTCSLEKALDRIFTQSGKSILDYMKIDCECSEYDFLMNKNLSCIRYIGMELHNQLGENKTKELYDFISETHVPSVVFSHNKNKNIELMWTLK
jgi:FkbM family methyltransferase